MELKQIQIDLLHESVNVLVQLRHQIHNNNVIPQQLANDIITLAGDIEKVQQLSQQGTKYIDYSKDQNVQKRLKPQKDYQITKQSNQCKEILNRDWLNERILPFLSLKEVIQIRIVNSQMKENVEYHLKQRIQMEEKWLAHHLFSSQYLKQLKEFLFNQMPKDEWIIYDQLQAKEIIKKYIKDLEYLKKLRTAPEQYDEYFKPLVMLFNGKQKRKNQSYLDMFKKINIKQNLLDNSVIKCIEAIREIKDIKKISRFSKQCSNSILWCQAQVSLYLLENIFNVRINKESPLAELADFYRKRSNLINTIKKILKHEQKFVIFLNFAPQLNQRQIEEQKITKQDLLIYILQYCDLESLLKCRLVSKSVKQESEHIIHQMLQTLYTE